MLGFNLILYPRLSYLLIALQFTKVLDDADMEAAARSITSGALLGSGQICMSTERVVVQRGAAPTLVPALQKYFSQSRAGDIHSDPETKITPLINEGAAESVLGLIQEAKVAGAELLLGDLTRDGAVVQPHILNGIKPGMRVFDRESFGPRKRNQLSHSLKKPLFIPCSSCLKWSESL